MGRFVLILTAVLSVTAATFAISNRSTMVEGTKRRATTEAGTLARQAAQSGFDVAEKMLLRDFSQRPNESGVGIDASGAYGTYDVETAEIAPGHVRVSVLGRFGGAAHRIETDLIQSLDFPGAIALHSDEADASFSGTGFLVDGKDSVPPSAPAGSQPRNIVRPAVVGSNPAVSAQVRAKISSSQLPQFRGAEPVKTSTLPAWVHQAVDEARNDPTATRYTGDLKAKNQTFGSPTSPAVVLVTKNAVLEEGVRGYGILIVSGELQMKKDALWEGMVVVIMEPNDEGKAKLEGTSAIYGALVLYGTESAVELSDTVGLPGGHFDLDIFQRDGTSMKRIFHQHEYDDKNNLTGLDFLNGPELNTRFPLFVTSRGMKPTRVEFFNRCSASGTYVIKAGSTTWSGLSSGGFSATLAPIELTQIKFDFVSLKELRGTSPGRVSGDPQRDNSFSVRFFESTTLLYEVSAYEHVKGDIREGTGCLPKTEVQGEVAVSYGKAKVEMKDTGSVRLSLSALDRLRTRLDAVKTAATIRTVVRRNVSIHS